MCVYLYTHCIIHNTHTYNILCNFDFNIIINNSINCTTIIIDNNNTDN